MFDLTIFAVGMPQQVRDIGVAVVVLGNGFYMDGSFVVMIVAHAKMLRMSNQQRIPLLVFFWLYFW